MVMNRRVVQQYQGGRFFEFNSIERRLACGMCRRLIASPGRLLVFATVEEILSAKGVFSQEPKDVCIRGDVYVYRFWQIDSAKQMLQITTEQLGQEVILFNIILSKMLEVLGSPESDAYQADLLARAISYK